ncbi:MAG: Na(+)-translocating NADH-quinone reductase subunit C [Woeseia sp.]
MPDSRDSIANTFTVAIGISLVCSILVSAASVLLKSRQEVNEARYQHEIVLQVAGLYEPDTDIETVFAGIDVRLVDLESGDYVDSLDARDFDHVAASKDPKLSIAIPADQDSAGLHRRAIYAPVYLVRDGPLVSEIILPVYGSGLWSTMYGYVALAADGTTVRGLRFYQHAETPGLGDQIDRADWLDKWQGKQAFDDSGQVRISVVRGQVQEGRDAIYEIDGMSGATLTGRGVTRLLHYWLGPNGFGPYLQKFNSQAARND